MAGDLRDTDLGRILLERRDPLSNILRHRTSSIHLITSLWVIGLFTAVLTAVYMTRLMWMTFYGSERFHDALPDDSHAGEASYTEQTAFAEGVASRRRNAQCRPQTMKTMNIIICRTTFKPHESPWTMTAPLVVLAFLSTFGGLVGIPYAISSALGRGDINVFERTLEPIIAKVGVKAEHARRTGGAR